MNRSCKHTFRPDCEDLEGRQLLSASPSVTKLQLLSPTTPVPERGPLSQPQTPSRLPPRLPPGLPPRLPPRLPPSITPSGSLIQATQAHLIATTITIAQSIIIIDIILLLRTVVALIIVTTIILIPIYIMVAMIMSLANSVMPLTPTRERHRWTSNMGRPAPCLTRQMGARPPSWLPPCLRRRDHGSGRNRPGAVCGRIAAHSPVFSERDRGSRRRPRTSSGSQKGRARCRSPSSRRCRPATDRTVSSIERITSVSSHRPMGIRGAGQAATVAGQPNQRMEI